MACISPQPLQIFTCDQLLTYLRSFTAVKEEVKEEVKQVEVPAGLKPFKRQEIVDEMFTGVPKKAPVQKGKVGRVFRCGAYPLTPDGRAAALAVRESTAGFELCWCFTAAVNNAGRQCIPPDLAWRYSARVRKGMPSAQRGMRARWSQNLCLPAVLVLS